MATYPTAFGLLIIQKENEKICREMNTYLSKFLSYISIASVSFLLVDPLSEWPSP